MYKLVLPCATAVLLLAGAASAQTNEFATANMHFNANDMDANHDGKVTMDEMKAYGDNMWAMMAKDAPSIPVADAARDFSRGNLKFSARQIDTDHDGTISKDEFMKYAATKFDKMKTSDGTVSVTDMAKAFSRGNTHPDAAKQPADATSPSK